MNLEGVRRIYILGDLHFGIRNNSLEWFEIQKSFLLDYFIEKIKEDGFDPEKDILLQLGDWNHVRESTNVRIQNGSLQIMQELSSIFKKGIFIILGNHDVYYKDRTDTHSLKGLDLIFKNIHIFEKPNVLTINSKHKFLMLPWIESDEEISSIVSKSVGKIDYLACHADIKDFRLNKWTKLEHGLDQTMLSSFKRVYSGHIHIRQENNNLLYVGTPYEMDRGDSGNVKGFYVLDLSENKPTERFIENTFSPKHLKFNITDLLNKDLDSLKKILLNNFVDVYLENSFASNFPLTQFTDMIKDFGHRRLEFFTYSDQLDKKTESELSSSQEYNIFDILDEKIKARNYSVQFSNEVVSKFKEIYEKIKNTKSYE